MILSFIRENIVNASTYKRTCRDILCYYSTWRYESIISNDRVPDNFCPISYENVISYNGCPFFTSVPTY